MHLLFDNVRYSPDASNNPHRCLPRWRRFGACRPRRPGGLVIWRRGAYQEQPNIPSYEEDPAFRTPQMTALQFWGTLSRKWSHKASWMVMLLGLVLKVGTGTSRLYGYWWYHGSNAVYSLISLLWSLLRDHLLNGRRSYDWDCFPVRTSWAVFPADATAHWDIFPADSAY